MTDTTTADVEPFSVLSSGPFTLFWLMRGAVSAAAQIMTISLGWQVYDLTHDPLDLGLIGLAQFLPAFLLALPAGHAIDRYRRRTIVRASLAVYVFVAATLCAASALGLVSTWLIFPMAALLGGARAFQHPAMSAFLAGLVPRAHFGQAIAWSASVFQTATIVGPAVGGALYGFGADVTYGACTALFAISLGLALALPPAVQILSQEPPSVRSVLAGLKFIVEQKDLLGAISLDLFGVLLGGATALLPVYARDILLVGPFGLGLLRSAPAVGALGVATILSKWPLQRHNGLAMLAGVAMFGVATCVFAVSRNLALSFAVLAVLGASDMVSVFVRMTLVQLRTPDAMRGRVSAVNSIFIGTSNQLGEFESGVTAAWFGTVPAVLLGGIGTLLVVGLWALWFPGLRRIDRLEDPVDQEPVTARAEAAAAGS